MKATALNELGWLAGVRVALPYTAVYAPFGLVIGAAADHARVDDFLGWSTAWVTYGGTAQLAVIQMLNAGTSPPAVLGAVLLINLRLVAYAISIYPQWRTAPTWWKLIASYVLIDPAYVIATEQAQRMGSERSERYLRDFYLGSGITLWAVWLVVCGVGVTLGSHMAALVPTTTLADLMLVSMLALLARDLGTRVAAAAGVVLGIPALALPGGSGPTIAAVAASLIAVASISRRLK